MKRPAPKSMIVAGIMSGTSADGVDVALCRVTPAHDAPRLKVLGHRAFPYERKLRAAVLAAMDAQSITTAELSRLHWRLGKVYADCVEATARDLNKRPQLIACHGQTIYHQANAANYLGKPVRATWQIGEPAVIAERLRLPVVSDFRPADLAAGGQAAPLVPMLDFCVFRHAAENRILLNLGGIANLTALPAAATPNAVMAFDTGPANMVIDACMQRLYNRAYDAHGDVAASGQVHDSILQLLLRDRYYATPPPKSCGREQFGSAFVERFLALCAKSRLPRQDIVATATAFTAATIVAAYRDFAAPHLATGAPHATRTRLFAAGGGTHNAVLMAHLTEGFHALNVQLATTAAAGLAVEAKEAAAFALLGWLSWHGLPGNIPSATGAQRAVVLGRISLV